MGFLDKLQEWSIRGIVYIGYALWVLVIGAALYTLIAEL